MDRYYTPKSLAESIIDRLPDFDPKIAADFAAGEGALIDAIRRRWPKCKVYGTDIDRTAVVKLRRRLPKVSAGICNFFSKRSRNRSSILSGRQKNIPLIFLNPPFSSRGHRFDFEFEGRSLRSSRALAFSALALQYLSSNGRLIALLPSSCLTSERDAVALAEISRSYFVKVLRTAKTVQFIGCSVDVVVVQFQRRKNRKKSSMDPINVFHLHSNVQMPFKVAIARGRLPMADAARFRTKQGLPLVHTTSLQKGAIVFDQGRIKAKTSSLSGPFVLISRVGRPKADKICIFPKVQPVILSECVIAISAGSVKYTRILHQLLRSQSRILLQCYVGSCAKYLTINRLIAFLESLGISIVSFEELSERKTKAA